MEDINLDERYFELDDMWPVKRQAFVKAGEKEILSQALSGGAEWEDIKEDLQALISEAKPWKLPALVSYLDKFLPQKIEGPMKVCVATPCTPYSGNNQVVEVLAPQSEVEIAFKEIFAIWPENPSRPQNKFKAHDAWVNKCAERSLDEVRMVSQFYINEFNTPSNGILFPFSIKGLFYSEDDVYDAYLLKCKLSDGKSYDQTYFDAAWNWYPDFDDRQGTTAKRDGLIMYRRFINDSNMIDFLCAVKAFRSLQCETVFDGNGEPIPDKQRLKYRKSFYSFSKSWESMREDTPCEYDKQVAAFLETEIWAVCNEKGLKLQSAFDRDLANSWLRYEAVKKTKAIDIPGLFMREAAERLEVPLDHTIVPEIVFRLKEKCKAKRPLPEFIGGVPFDQHPDKKKYLERD
jgi:hypothetical protein